jgi:type I restriction enzyme R subunit
MPRITESEIESAALDWFEGLGYTVAYGPSIAPGEPNAERETYYDVVLVASLRAAVDRLNPEMPAEARDEAVAKVLRIATPSLVATNRAFHTMLRDGVDVEYSRADGSIKGDKAHLLDFEQVDANEWFVANQYTVGKRRPDIVVFVNGLPLAVIELKNIADEDATVEKAFAQLQTYKVELDTLMQYNALLVASDGLSARMGSLTANFEWFKVWRKLEDSGTRHVVELDVLLHEVFERRNFLDMVQHFIVFETDPESGVSHKIIAGYHQFYAVNAALAQTLRASGLQAPAEIDESDDESDFNSRKPGDRRVGVVWHTQGSGKSFTMLFFAARIIREAAMKNPTLVILTDRNDLDDQLFGQFNRCYELLGQEPVQAESREALQQLLARASGGVIFTTIQKFMPERGEAMPELSARENIVVIADEAHRSQYGFHAKVDQKSGLKSRGFATNLRQALPNASFVGFTGTPIEQTDANTRAVFGDYISVYDIQRAVEDKATVPILYESRVAKLSLNESELPELDDEFEELTEGEEVEHREKLKSKWAALEALVGDPKRIALIAKDLVDHFEQRSRAISGKAMVVCMSRRICVELYKELIALRPEWESAPKDDIELERGRECVVKVIMTGSADDGPEWQAHVRGKQARRTLAKRFKDSSDPFKIVIVRDMWLTGFDAPCLQTMYADKPMQGAGLMQAIARVNRVFKDKPGGLVVDYLGLADQLKKALATYTQSGGQGDPVTDTRKAVLVMLEKHGVACDLLHGLDWSLWADGTPAQRLALIPAGQDIILGLADGDGKARFIKTVTELSRAFAMCATSDEATKLLDDISFFQTLQAALSKRTIGGGKSAEQLDAAVRQLVSKAISTDGEVIDVFTAAGLARPDISILSDQFLAEVRALKHKNVAAELLEKLLHDELRTSSRTNIVQSKLLSEKLKATLNAYHNRAISSVEVIEELIKIAKETAAANRRGEELGLSSDEVAFYDALAANDSAIEAMGDKQLKVIAAELIAKVRSSVTIDWNLRESARAKIRTLVKRILRKYGYPPDLQDQAVQTVLAQAELLCANWV